MEKHYSILNNPLSIAKEIKNKMNNQEYTINIVIFDNNGNQLQWFFDKDNLNDLETAFSILEYKYQKNIYYSVFLNIREFKNGQILIYRIFGIM